MDSLVTQALRAGRGAPVPRRRVGERVLLAGAAGALGAAVLEHLLGASAFVEVAVLVERPLGVAVPGLSTVNWSPANGVPLGLDPPVSSAVVVFDRGRHANGREQAFWRPEPPVLLELARQLRHAGVRRLVVVQPHAAAGLPEALRLGLANLDEQALAGLGFDHLVLMKPAQSPLQPAAAHPGHRLARWLLSQLQLMVPAQHQPVRSDQVARFAVHIAAALPQATPGTRVAPADLVWEAAQRRDSAPLAADWLAGRPIPPRPAPRRRM